MFDLDEIDRQIIRELQKDPNVTHSAIAEILDRSQPAIGQRIKKLRKNDFLATQIGVDFKDIDMLLVKVELVTRKPEEVILMAQHCPFIVNGLKLSGQFNFMLFIASTSLKKINNVIDFHFRNKPYITAVKMDIVVGYAKSFILPVDFEAEMRDPNLLEGCGKECDVRKFLEQQDGNLAKVAVKD